MKIAVNTRLLIPNKMDGIGRFTIETLKLIAHNHPEVEFTFIFDRKEYSKEFDFPENVNIIHIGPPARHPILWYLWFEIRIKRYINKNKFDLFLSPEGWIPPNLNCRSLAVIHDLNFEHYPENIAWSHRIYLQYFFKKFAKRATRIATVSNYSKLDISSTYQILESDIDLVYNGANSIFKPLTKSQKEKIKAELTSSLDYFLFIGSLHPRKNLEHLLHAFDQFKETSKSSNKLLIAGNKKWWPAKLDRLHNEMNFKNDVVFLGRLDDIKLAEVLGAAMALTYLPYFEGFGIPIIEAFQANIPVITSDVTSMPEVANNSALLCDPRNIKEIAEAMYKIEKDEALRASLIEKGGKRAADFSWKKTSTLLWESIEKTLA